MEEKKIKKWPIVVLVLLILLLIGSTFAWLRIQIESTTVNKLKAGSLSMTLDDETSSGIKLINAVPMSYQQGIGTTEYTFTLTNEGAVSDYKIALIDELTYTNESNEEVTITETDKLEDSKIRYLLLKNKEKEDADATESKLLSELTDRVIDSGTIQTDETITYHLFVWIDSKAGDNNTQDQVMGKIFNARLRLDAIQHSNIESTNFAIGDYVSMTPTSTSYTIDTAMTGYDSTQTINPSELNLWRVIRINDDQTVDMVSEYVSSTDVSFQGYVGYQNFVGYLNTIAQQYENANYTVGSRHMGYDGSQTGYITDTTALTSTPPPQAESTSSTNVTSATEVKGLGDMGYETDYNLVKTALGGREAYKVGTMTLTGYWLASRYYSYFSSDYWLFIGRNIYADGGMNEIFIFYYYSYGGFHADGGSNAIRPIVTLKSGIKAASGDGSSASPYVLS